MDPQSERIIGATSAPQASGMPANPLMPAAPPAIPGGSQPLLSDTPQLTPAIQTPLTQAPSEAADTDVIEPEWVNRAKQLVAENQGDPYKQVRALNQLRAEYMKKRYNKDIKLPDA